MKPSMRIVHLKLPRGKISGGLGRDEDNNLPHSVYEVAHGDWKAGTAQTGPERHYSEGKT